jgi:hypothetical protein
MRIAVTGHRWNRLPKAIQPALPGRIREGLVMFDEARENKTQTPWLLTGLAEGADRLAAREALLLGWRLHAVLPFEIERYEQDFENKESVAQFRRLLDQCQRTDELMGSVEGQYGADGPYVELGHTLVRGSDAVLAVWDGKPAAGPGGTPHVVQMALANGQPVLWINVSEPNLPMMRGEGPGRWVGLT